MERTEIFEGLILTLQAAYALIALPLMAFKTLLPLLWWVGLIYSAMQFGTFGVIAWCGLILFLVWLQDTRKVVPDKLPTKADVEETFVDGVMLFAMRTEK